MRRFKTVNARSFGFREREQREREKEFKPARYTAAGSGGCNGEAGYVSRTQFQVLELAKSS
jgi:hypothetical protein